MKAIAVLLIILCTGCASGPSGDANLQWKRREATKNVINGMLRDATYQFTKEGENKLRVRVRAQNAFGGHVVWTFVLTFPPGSFIASSHKEL